MSKATEYIADRRVIQEAVKKLQAASVRRPDWRIDGCRASFDVRGDGTPGLSIDTSSGRTLSSENAIMLAEWILDNFKD